MSKVCPLQPQGIIFLSEPFLLLHTPALVQFRKVSLKKEEKINSINQNPICIHTT